MNDRSCIVQMKLDNIAGCKSISEFVSKKTEILRNTDHSFNAIFELMFSEKTNIFFEESEGFDIKRTTYGEAYDRTLILAKAIKDILKDESPDSVVGLDMENGPLWVEGFWAIILAGFRPLLVNDRLPEKTLEEVRKDLKVVYTLCEDSLPIMGDEKLDPKTADTGSEFFVMSSGTSEHVKICAYRPEAIVNQIYDSYSIIKECKEIRKHYNGYIKQLTLLPFYHVFGLFAVYFWFGFFSRTFVKLNDMQPQTILDTIRRHEVTHVFAVPMFWDKVYSAAMREIRKRGKETYEKFQKGRKIGRFIPKIAFKEIRENLFGESICFMISGGSFISEEVLSFFNTIGYRLANGYGMSEIGITSVETSSKYNILCSGSVGRPFHSIQYDIDEAGELVVHSSSMASYIYSDSGVVTPEGVYATRDIAEERNGRYYLGGRSDDIIITSSGENINPYIIEKNADIEGIDTLCLVKGHEKAAVIAHVNSFRRRADAIREDIKSFLDDAKIKAETEAIILTEQRLIEENEFKVNRRKIQKKYLAGELYSYDDESRAKTEKRGRSAYYEKVNAVFCKALDKEPGEVGDYEDFFIDGGGDSLGYLSMMAELENTYEIDFPSMGEKSLSTIGDIVDYIEQSADKHS